MVDGAFEEALNLSAVQVHRHHSLGARGLEHVGNDSSGDRLATGGLAVLARVTVERAYGGDALCRCAIRRIDHDELLHDGVVDAVPVVPVVRLHDEHVATTDAFAESRADLAVCKLDDIGFAERNVEVTCYFTGKFGMCTTGVEHHPFGGDFVDRFVHFEPA